MIVRLLFALLLALPALTQTMYRGDPAHSGVYDGRAMGPELAGMQWRFETGGGVISSPIVSGQMVYVGSGDGNLYALDRRTGAERWRFDAGSPVASSPALAAGTVFFAARNGAMFAVDAANGALRWRVDGGADLPLPWGHESGDHYIASPVIDGDAVDFAGGDGIVRQHDAVTGKVRWQKATGERIRSSPALAHGRLYLGTVNGHVLALDAKNGNPVWRFRTDGVTIDSSQFGFDRHTIQSSPVVADGKVLVGARDGKLYALDAATGKVQWTQSHGTSWIITSPAVSDGVVYLASSDAGFAQALRLADGTEVWKFKTGSPVWSSPAVAGDTVYFGDFLGRLHAVDRRSGQARWFFRAGAHVFGSPVVDGNLLFFGSADGAVYALRTGTTRIHRAALIRREGELAQMMTNRGYTALDEASLVTFLADRVKDREPSVIVIATGNPPESKVLTVPDLRPYLRAGGKIVWAGPPPNIWKPAPASLLDVDYTGPTRVTNVDHSTAIFDPRATRATATGRRWSLGPHTWRDDWGVPIANVTEPLAIDDWGLATSWLQTYGGPEGTGFVRMPVDSLSAIYWAAEYRPE